MTSRTNGTRKTRRLRVLLTLVLATALAANADDSSEKKPGIDTVVITAQKRRELDRQISHFVFGAVVSYMNDSLERWDTPICPLVAGLSGDRGEFVFTRVTEIAKAAHAHLGEEHCKPNFYIVVTAYPDLLLAKWVKRDIGLVNNCNGMGYIKSFLHSRQPVRVFYNAVFRSSTGMNHSLDTAGTDLIGLNLPFNLSPCAAVDPHPPDSRLRYGVVQELSSVIVVVDSTKTTNINIGQLTDYVALLGLAQIKPEANPGTAPSILNLFRETGLPAPQGLSPWDEAFLHSLYTTDQTSTLQVSVIKGRMLDELANH